MKHFFKELKFRNIKLYYFGWLCTLSSLICLIFIFTTSNKVLGINAWIKPFKFFLSSTIFVWTMNWITHYLQEKRKVLVYSWVVILVLAFETIYIALQASKGELSHFNISTPFYSVMYSLMGVAITTMTFLTGYIGFLFFRKTIPDIPVSYLWGIRLGIIIFVIFALEGGIMAANLSHTVGTADGGKGLPLLNWSLTKGDLRIAHFMGMHSLQILPLIGFYISKSAKITIAISLIYFLITTVLLLTALAGQSIFI